MGTRTRLTRLLARLQSLDEPEDGDPSKGVTKTRGGRKVFSPYSANQLLEMMEPRDSDYVQTIIHRLQEAGFHSQASFSMLRCTRHRLHART